MTVIQDLPPEVLYRILELVEESRDVSMATSLANSSLVARAWREPAQEVLLENVNPTYLRPYRLATGLRSIAGKTLGDVHLHGWWHAQDMLDTLHEHDIAARGLGIINTHSNDVDLSGMSIKFLAGLKSLRIAGYFAGQPEIPQNTTLKLKVLGFDIAQPPPLPFLESLFQAAPFLTYLELPSDGMWPLPEEYYPILSSIAPRLQHLTISAITAPIAFDSLSFVASCTSLRSLELQHGTPSNINKMLTAVSTTLLVLGTELDSMMCQLVGTMDGIAELTALLDRPALSALKRWRITSKHLPAE
uniref:F-box domain-containing protein n=1 Tax=Leucosporidium scottii TaxID=5278 RepID=A0A0H5FSA8_9BASI|nr:hypothetical protein [Leucosporidium scottii]